MATTSCKETSSTPQSDAAASSTATPTATATATAKPTASALPTVTANPSAAAASNDAAPPGDAGLAATTPAGSTSNVYPWEPAIVEIPGRLAREPVAYSNGPVPVVIFDKPIRIETPGEPDRVLPRVTKAWLSYNGISKDEVDKLMGKKVTYKGALNHMGTAHHLSDPWLDGTVTAR